MSSQVWSMKEKGMASRLAREFGEEDMKKMIEWWCINAKEDVAPRFNIFYNMRHTVNKHINKRDYEWD